MRSIIIFISICVTVQSLEAAPSPRLNFFDIDLLRYTAEKPGNIVLSPVSIKSTLAMLLEGVEGETASEIKSALRLLPTGDDFRQELIAYFNALEVNTTVSEVHSANGLFASDKFKLKKRYETILREVYATDVRSLNFTDSRAAAEFINRWVNLKTAGQISSIVEEVQVNPSSELVVVNALYFKSSWAQGFDPKLTHTACFYKDGGACKNVPTMELENELNYAYMDSLRAHAVELPYQGGRYSMILLVPQDRAAVASLIRDLPYVGLPTISKALEPVDVILSMPKFTIDYSEDIVGILKKTGIQSLFSTKGNLSRIFEGSYPNLNSIQHCVHLDVNEGGTVAASVTGGLLVPLMANQVHLNVDRPFLFFIRDNMLGSIVFEGKIEDPMVHVELNVLKEQQQTPISVPKKTSGHRRRNHG